MEKSSMVAALLAFILGLPMGAVEGSTSSEAPSRDMLFLVVDKSRLQAELRSWPQNYTSSRALMKFQIAVGKKEGDKQKEGDNRTPEGIYFAKSIINGSQLPAKYGANAIPIDFPNPHDTYLGKTGYGIWLHGVERDQRIAAANITEGCVAFFNRDIRALTKWLHPKQAIVIIANDSTTINRPHDLAALRESTSRWIEAWRTRNLNAYGDFYHPDFRYKSKSRLEYLRYKKRVFASYKQILLSTDQMRVFAHERYGLAIMNQDFKGDKRYSSRGRKILYWLKESGGTWTIIHEKFDDFRLEFPLFTSRDVAHKFRNSPSLKRLNNDSQSTRL